jgi:hypothetical protein
MERARATWTDERLDDLSRRVDAGFARVDADVRELRARFDHVDARIDSLQHTMIQVGVGMMATQLVGFASLIALHFT